jgi:hypothetical protein
MLRKSVNFVLYSESKKFVLQNHLSPLVDFGPIFVDFCRLASYTYTQNEFFLSQPKITVIIFSLKMR